MRQREARAKGFPHPASFPIGSPESRAAARALAEGRNRVDEEFVVRLIFGAAPELPEKRLSVCRYANEQGKTVEFVVIEPDESTPEYREYCRRFGIE